jgi:hypothetical protein
MIAQKRKPQSSGRKQRKATEQPAPQRADVGYGRPPNETQFQPGKSGNPRGRPKGKKNLATVVNEVLNMPVAVSGAGRKRKVPLIHAALLGAAQNALKQDLKSLAFLVNLVRGLQDPEQADVSQPISTEDQKLLADALARLAEREEHTS